MSDDKNIIEANSKTHAASFHGSNRSSDTDFEMDCPTDLLRPRVKPPSTSTGPSDNIVEDAETPVSDGIEQGEEVSETAPPTTGLEAHPAANILPMMQADAFKNLVNSIRDKGQEEPIFTYKGKILDGRNRLAACKVAGVKPWVVEYDGDDPLDYVFRKNLYRRNLNKSQLGMAAARLANVAHGGDHKSEDFKTSIGGLKIEDAAEIFGVSPKTIERAKTVLASGNIELIEAVDSGDLTVSAAAKSLDEPEEPAVSISTYQQQSKRLLNLWNKTSEEGREQFLAIIKRDDQAANSETLSQ
jgi:ParB-like chromosome segregation protein Spo0J